MASKKNGSSQRIERKELDAATIAADLAELKAASREKKARSRFVDREPTADELAQAVRSLHDTLGGVVRFFEERRKLGETDAEAWRRIRWLQPAGKRDRSRLSGPELAIRAYASRNVMEGRRKTLGRRLAELSLRLARHEISTEEAIKEAARLRADGGPPKEAPRVGSSKMTVQLRDLPSELKRVRAENTAWQQAYVSLSWDADVEPRADTRRGLRGDNKKLYASATHNLERSRT